MNDQNDPNHFSMCSLSPADQHLLDALIDAEFDRARVAQSLGRTLTSDEHTRLTAITRMLGRLDDYPIEDAEPALMHATMARIDRHEDELALRMRFDVAMDEQAATRGFRIRIPDFITVAAVLLIGVGVLWPVLGSVRQQAMQTSCANNLKRIGYGFAQYANDNNGSLPVAMAGPMGSWESFSNAINLSPMVQGGYCEAGHLNCPGHHAHDEHEPAPSYSYRWFTPKGLIHWNTGRVTVILGDLNPLVAPARRGWDAPPLSVSINHRGRGQNVLTTDGSVMWLEQPLVGRHDNIWMPEGGPSLRPGHAPTDDDDVFLVH